MTCSIDHCGKKVHARGWCRAHYQRWKRTGDPAHERQRRPCSVAGCVELSSAKTFCRVHYHRWLRYGDPLGSSGIFGTPEDRFWNHVSITPSCWLWTASDNGRGYGVLGTGEKPGGKVYAHRLSYEIHVGPIPDGLHIDHLCRVRNCVNPMHLEAVTPEENNRRSGSPSGKLARQTHCKYGHELTPENVYLQQVKGRKSPSRQCRACMRRRNRAAYWRNKQKADKS